jgi:hypothetical protein
VFFDPNMRTFFGLWEFGAEVSDFGFVFFVVFPKASQIDQNLDYYFAFDVL